MNQEHTQIDITSFGDAEQPRLSACQRRRKIRPLGGAKLGHYSRHAGKRREGVARAVLACVRGDFRRSVQAV